MTEYAVKPAKINGQVIDFGNPAARQRFLELVAKLNGPFRVEIKRQRQQRSGRQNRYYWGVVLPAIVQGMREAWGESLTPEEAHELLLQRFLSRPVVNKQTGEAVGAVTVMRSSTLTVGEFASYLKQISDFAAADLGVLVPSADSYQQMEA